MNGDATTTPTTTPITSRIEQINQGVRAYCVSVMVSCFCFVFVAGLFMQKPVVSTDGFIGVMAGIVGWWFKSQDDQRRRADLAAATTTTTTTTPPAGSGDPTKTVTGPTPPAGG